MKDKILLFIIGVLVGAVISTGAFFVYTKLTINNSTSQQTQMQMPGGNMQGMPSGENGQPPERPGETNSKTTQSNSSSSTKTNSQTTN
jgi:hypothetical protein